MFTMCQMAQLMKKLSITFIHHHILSSHYCQPHLTSKETELNKLPKVTKVENGGTKIAIESVRRHSPSSSPSRMLPLITKCHLETP